MVDKYQNDGWALSIDGTSERGSCQENATIHTVQNGASPAEPVGVKGSLRCIGEGTDMRTLKQYQLSNTGHEWMVRAMTSAKRTKVPFVRKYIPDCHVSHSVCFSRSNDREVNRGNQRYHADE